MSEQSRAVLLGVLARRFARSLPQLRCALPAAFAMLVLAAANVILGGQTLSPQQTAQDQLGRGASEFQYERNIAYGAPGVVAASRRLKAHPGVELSVRAFDFSIGELTDGVDYLEAPWPGLRGSNYALIDGRWPRRPGEVALVNYRDQDTRLGTTLDVLGGKDRATVVGIASGELSRQRAVLAAPGSWARFGAGETNGQLAEITGQVSLLFAEAVSTEKAKVIAGEMAESLYGDKKVEPAGALITSESAAARAMRPWIDRSPILFWFPGLALVAAASYLTFAGLSRSLVPAISAMRRTGLATATAVSAPWSAVLSRVVAGAVCGYFAGWIVGRQGGGVMASRWGNPSPRLDWPAETIAIGIVGVLAGAMAAWYALRSRVLPPRQAAARGVEGQAWDRLVTVASAGLGCVAVFLLVTMHSPWQMLTFVCVCIGLAALGARRLTLMVAAMLPGGQLSGRLVKRLISTYLLRTASFVAVLAVGLGLSTAIAISVQSAVAAERTSQGTTAPPGFVALDNDDAPSIAVPAAVTRAAERVDAMKEQSPIQLWTTGRQVLDDNGRVEVRDSVTTAGAIVPMFAIESVDDFETIAGQHLSQAQRRTLTGGGVLIIDDAVPLAEPSVQLESVETQASIGDFRAARADVRPAPWFVAVPGYMLVSTARHAGLPVSRGATIYTHVSSADAARVQRELTLAGIHPENAEIYYKLPPVLPDAALIVGCAAVFTLIVGMAALLARSQVKGMRAWVDQLRRIGVPVRWARRALLTQYAVLVVLGLAVGAGVGLGAILLAKLRLPAMVIEVPWTVVMLGAAATIAACVVSVALALRQLGRADPVGLDVGFE